MGRDGKVRIWDTNTDALLQELSVSTDDLYVVRFSPDGGRLAAAGLDGNVSLWDRSGIRLATLRGTAGRSTTSTSTGKETPSSAQGATARSAPGTSGCLRTFAARSRPPCSTAAAPGSSPAARTGTCESGVAAISAPPSSTSPTTVAEPGPLLLRRVEDPQLCDRWDRERPRRGDRHAARGPSTQVLGCSGPWPPTPPSAARRRRGQRQARGR